MTDHRYLKYIYLKINGITTRSLVMVVCESRPLGPIHSSAHSTNMRWNVFQFPSVEKQSTETQNSCLLLWGCLNGQVELLGGKRRIRREKKEEFWRQSRVPVKNINISRELRLKAFSPSSSSFRTLIVRVMFTHSLYKPPPRRLMCHLNQRGI